MTAPATEAATGAAPEKNPWLPMYESLPQPELNAMADKGANLLDHLEQREVAGQPFSSLSPEAQAKFGEALTHQLNRGIDVTSGEFWGGAVKAAMSAIPGLLKSGAVTLDEYRKFWGAVLTGDKETATTQAKTILAGVESGNLGVVDMARKFTKKLGTVGTADYGTMTPEERNKYITDELTARRAMREAAEGKGYWASKLPGEVDPAKVAEVGGALNVMNLPLLLGPAKTALGIAKVVEAGAAPTLGQKLAALTVQKTGEGAAKLSRGVLTGLEKTGGALEKVATPGAAAYSMWDFVHGNPLAAAAKILVIPPAARIANAGVDKLVQSLGWLPEAAQTGAEALTRNVVVPGAAGAAGGALYSAPMIYGAESDRQAGEMLGTGVGFGAGIGAGLGTVMGTGRYAGNHWSQAVQEQLYGKFGYTPQFKPGETVPPGAARNGLTTETLAALEAESAKLDTEQEKIDPIGRNQINRIRAMFQPPPVDPEVPPVIGGVAPEVKIFSVGKDTFGKLTGHEDARGYKQFGYAKPDGTRVTVVLLNADTGGSHAILHEVAGHFVQEDLLQHPEKLDWYKTLQTAHPEGDINQFGQIYDLNHNLNLVRQLSGKPVQTVAEFYDALEKLSPADRSRVQLLGDVEADNQFKGDPETVALLNDLKIDARRLGILKEMGAEALSNAARGYDGKATPEAVKKRMLLYAGGLLEAMKLHQPGVLGDFAKLPADYTTANVLPGGVSPLGVGHSFRLTELGQKFLREHGITIPEGTPVDTSPEAVKSVNPAQPVIKPPRPVSIPVAPANPQDQKNWNKGQRENPVVDFGLKGTPDDRAGWDRAENVLRTSGADADTLAKLRALRDAEGNPVVVTREAVTAESGAAQKGESRRAEREAAYQQAATEAGAPARTPNTERLVPIRVKIIHQVGEDGKVTPNVNLVTFSPDTVENNAALLTKALADAKLPAQDFLPFETDAAGRLTTKGFADLNQAVEVYSQNQSHGYQGSGKELAKPEGYQPVTPARDPNFTPTPLDDKTANAVNLLMGLEPPTTSKKGATVSRDLAGRVITTPGNVSAQQLAKANLRPVEASPLSNKKIVASGPNKGLPRDFFKDYGVSVGETNPLRAELARKGINLQKLFKDAVNEINLEDIHPNIQKLDSNLRPVSSPVIEGGFMPPEAPRVDNTALGLPVEGVDSDVRYAGEDIGLTPARFMPSVAGDNFTPVSESYPDAIKAGENGKRNGWVRQSAEKDNSGRVLLVQFAPDLMYPNGPDPVSTPYYDLLYSGARRGYDRSPTFWELPQWQAQATHALGEMADGYYVHNVEEAKNFFKEAKYGHVAFSVMDVSRALTEDVAGSIDGKIHLGGYTDTGGITEKYPNAVRYDSMNQFVESFGIPYTKGFDYRLFRGTEIIPRLELSAGCRHRCTFCTIDRKVTESPMSEIEGQVDSFKDLNAGLIYLNDKTFGQAGNAKDLPRLFERMKASNPDFGGFVVQTTAAQMHLFTDDFLKSSGIRYVEVGVETYNDPILKTLRKPATEKLIDEAAEKLRRNGINFIPNIVIGFPGETAETYAHTMDWLKKNEDIVSHVNTYNLAVYQGTEISKTLKATTAADADENSPTKSFFQDPKIHEAFAKQIYDYGSQQLRKTPVTQNAQGFMPAATVDWPGIVEQMRKLEDAPWYIGSVNRKEYDQAAQAMKAGMTPQQYNRLPLAIGSKVQEILDWYHEHLAEPYSPWSTGGNVSFEGVPARQPESQIPKAGKNYGYEVGSFMPGEGQTLASPEERAQAIADFHNKEGGSTYVWSKGQFAKPDPTSYIVSIYPERVKLLNSAAISATEVQQFAEKNSDLLKNPENAVGSWANEGKTYLDVVVAVPDRALAEHLGKKFNQKAIWDVGNKTEIPTGGTGEAIQHPTPEHQRLEEAKGELNEHPVVKQLRGVLNDLADRLGAPKVSETAPIEPKNPAPAKFVYTQEAFGPLPAMDMYNLTQDIPGHVKGSTLSRRTLEGMGYEVPPKPGKEGTGAFMPPRRKKGYEAYEGWLKSTGDFAPARDGHEQWVVDNFKKSPGHSGGGDDVDSEQKRMTNYSLAEDNHYLRVTFGNDTIWVEPSHLYPTWRDVSGLAKRKLDELAFEQNKPVEFAGRQVIDKPRPDEASSAGVFMPSTGGNEANKDRLVLGYTNGEHVGKGVLVHRDPETTMFPNHDETLGARSPDTHFRFKPGEHTIYWWNKPGEVAEQNTEAFLEKKGYGKAPFKHDYINYKLADPQFQMSHFMPASPGWVGVTDLDHNTSAKKVADLSETSHDKLGLAGGAPSMEYQWRYNPANKTVYWWGKPDDPEIQQTVHEWLTKKESAPTKDVDLFAGNPKQMAISYGGAHGGKFMPGQPAFEQWKGKAQLYTADDDWNTVPNGKPVVLEAYHGTTHDFSVVDNSKFGTMESNLGRAFYASNTPGDVANNYAGVGPDLKNRIEQLADRLSGEEAFEDASYKKRLNEARRRLTEHGGATMKVYVRLEKPLKVGVGEPRWDIEYPEDDSESPSGELIDFVDALKQISLNYDDVGNLDSLYDHAGDKLSKIFGRASAIMWNATSRDTEDLASNQIINEALQKLGYDGVIDTSVDTKFGSGSGRHKPLEGMHPGTVHVIAFDKASVKSATGNRGTYDLHNRDINFMPSAPIWRDNIADALNSWQEKGTADQLRAHLAKFRGTKEQSEWIGLDDFLKDHPKVTKDEVRKFVAANAVELHEVMHGLPENRHINYDSKYALPEVVRIGEDYQGDAPGALEQALANNGHAYAALMKKFPELQENYDAGGDPWYGPVMADVFGNADNTVNTKYKTYTLPGGRNYRELLLTLPEKQPELLSTLPAKYSVVSRKPSARQPDALWTVMELQPDGTAQKFANGRTEQQARDIALNRLNADIKREAQSTGRQYSTSHWSEPNVLMHIRFNDREVTTYTPEQIADIGKRLTKAVGAKSEKSLGSGAPEVGVRKGAITPLEAAQYSHAKGFTSGVDQTSAIDKILHAEEIQADWHKEGRSKGYRNDKLETWTATPTPSTDGRYDVRNAEGRLVSAGRLATSPEQAIKEAHEQYPEYSKVPDAPFKQSWPLVAMKRMIRYAAEHDYNRLTWTTGEQQAERYDLSKHIEKVVATKTMQPGNFHIKAERPGGDSVFDDVVTTEKLPDVVGKELAAKIIADAPEGTLLPRRPTDAQVRDEASVSKPVWDKLSEAARQEIRRRFERKYGNSRTYSGLDLKIGGEHHKNLYDKQLPNEVNKFVKKWGGEVGMSELPGVHLEERYSDSGAISRSKNKTAPLPVHSLDITPEMKKAALEGMPMFMPQKGEALTDAGKRLEEKGFTLTPFRVMDDDTLELRDKKGKDVGFIQWKIEPPDGDSASVNFVNVDPKYRGQGMAETLYREMLTRLQNSGIHELMGAVVHPAPAKIREKLLPETRIVPKDASRSIVKNARGQGVQSAHSIIPEDAKFMPQPKAPFKNSDKLTPKMWLLPDGKTMVPLGGLWHEQWLDKNRDTLDKNYRLKLPKTVTVENRIDALQKGFVRIAYEPSSGRLAVEATQKAFTKPVRDRITELVADNAGMVDKMYVALFDGRGKLVKDDSEDLFRLDNSEKLDHLPLISSRGGAFMPATSGYLGMVNDDGVKGVPVKDLSLTTHEFKGMPESETRWRYNNKTKKIYWWGDPSDSERSDTHAWLTKRGLPIKGDADMSGLSEQQGKIFNEAHGQEFLNKFMPGGGIDLAKLPQETEQYEIMKPGDTPLDAGGGNYFSHGKFYLSPDNQWISAEEHEDAARELLGKEGVKPSSTDLNPNQAKLELKKGFVRVVYEDTAENSEAKGTLTFSTKPSARQLAELKNLAIENHLTLDDDTGGSWAKTIYTPGAGNFMPKARQQELGMPDIPEKKIYNAAEVARMNPTELRKRYPEAVVPKDPEALVSSDILGSPRYRKAADHAATVKSFADELIKKYEAAKDTPEAKLGEKWYSELTPLLKKEFGRDSQLFAELLAATSPGVTPSQSYADAAEAYDLLKSGIYDDIIKKYEEGLGKLADGSLEKSYRRKLKPETDPTPATLMKWWVDQHDLKPQKSVRYREGEEVNPNFHQNGLAVLQVLSRRWLNQNRGLKTSQFVKNLLGQDDNATIDLWADRTMREAGYKDFQDRWRILPANSAAIPDEDFKFSQEVFSQAADALKLKPSALQAALWFIEKKNWQDQGWGRADFGDYRPFIQNRIERRKLGQLQVKPAASLHQISLLPDKKAGLGKLSIQPYARTLKSGVDIRPRL